MESKKEIFKLLIKEFHELNPPNIIKRDCQLLESCTASSSPTSVIAITGPRRCGKTYFIHQLIEHFCSDPISPLPRDRLFYINFEDDRLYPLSLRDLAVLLDAYYDDRPLEYGLDRYDAHRDRNRKEITLSELKTYVVHYRPAAEPRKGLRELLTGIMGGERAEPATDTKRFPHDTPRIACLGVRPVYPEPLSDLDVWMDDDKRVQLLDPRATSVTGNGASHPNRSPDAINSVFRRHQVGALSAYVSAREKDPSLGPGKIVVRISIAPDGRVESAQIVSDSLKDGGLRADLLSRIRSWRFPPAEKGKVRTLQAVNLPYRFIAIEVSCQQPIC